MLVDSYANNGSSAMLFSHMLNRRGRIGKKPHK